MTRRHLSFSCAELMGLDVVDVVQAHKDLATLRNAEPASQCQRKRNSGTRRVRRRAPSRIRDQEDFRRPGLDSSQKSLPETFAWSMLRSLDVKHRRPGLYTGAIRSGLWSQLYFYAARLQYELLTTREQRALGPLRSLRGIKNLLPFEIEMEFQHNFPRGNSSSGASLVPVPVYQCQYWAWLGAMERSPSAPLPLWEDAASWQKLRDLCRKKIRDLRKSGVFDQKCHRPDPRQSLEWHSQRWRGLPQHDLLVALARILHDKQSSVFCVRAHWSQVLAVELDVAPELGVGLQVIAEQMRELTAQWRRWQRRALLRWLDGNHAPQNEVLNDLEAISGYEIESDESETDPASYPLATLPLPGTPEFDDIIARGISETNNGIPRSPQRQKSPDPQLEVPYNPPRPPSQSPQLSTPDECARTIGEDAPETWSRLSREERSSFEILDESHLNLDLLDLGSS